MCKISKLYGLSKVTVYQWYRGGSPHGRRAGQVAKVPELLYVVGALPGDGCIYHWRGNYQLWLVGEEKFTAKFADKLSLCLGRQVRHYKYGSKNAWFVRIGNAELFLLFQRVRLDVRYLKELAEEIAPKRGWLELIEGFFDAEGCVKIIRGRERRTPKICLDLCNTNLRLLSFVQAAIGKELGIKTGMSTQRTQPPRSRSYHLRIYSKAGVARFLDAIQTTKFTDGKRPFVESWLKKGNRESPTWRLSQACRPRRTN